MTPGRWNPAVCGDAGGRHLNLARCLAAVAFGLVTAHPARAEGPSGTRMYLEAGQIATYDFGMTTAELRCGSVTPLRPSFDFALPLAVVPGILTTPDLDLALPIPIAPGMRVIPRAGVTALVVYGGDIGGAALGWNVGAGLVVNSDGPLLLRADYTVRSFGSPGNADAQLHAVSAGIGWRF